MGRLLFGLTPTQYDELLRLLYWLRQPQVGEDIEPARLAEQLVQALPQLDDDAVRAAGDTFDELAAFGEQLDRQRRSAEGIEALATTYGHYAREVLRGRGTEAVEQHRERSRRARDAERCAADVAGLAIERAAVEVEQGTVAAQRRECEARLVELRGDPAWKDARELRARQEMARERATAAEPPRTAADGARRRAEASGERVRRDAGGLETAVSAHVVRVGELATELAGAGARVALPVPAALHDVHLLAVDAAQAAAEGLAGPGRCDPRRPPGPRRVARRRRGRRHRPHGARRRRRDPGARRAGRRRRRAAGRGGARPPGGRASRGHRRRRRVRGGARVVADGPAGRALRPARRADGRDGRRGGHARPRRGEPARWTLAGRRRRPRAPSGARPSGSTPRPVRRREEVAAERDPAPPAPPWRRDERDAADGAPLWRLVDFADALDARSRAGLEAALEASGLLDAWVRADGAVLDADRRDVVLPAGAPMPVPAGARLAAVLRPTRRRRARRRRGGPERARARRRGGSRRRGR